MPTNYITLTRQKLYEMVWSEPMISLAKSFGISDVALAKRCRAVNVPIPSATGRVRPRARIPRSCYLCEYVTLFDCSVAAFQHRRLLEAPLPEIQLPSTRISYGRDLLSSNDL